MRLMIATAYVVLAAAATNAGGSCRPLDYAEIKDTASPALLKTYCYYGGLADINSDGAKRMNELFVETLREKPQLVHTLKAPKDDPDYQELLASAARCREQQGKIAATLERRRVRVPDCKPRN